MAVKFVAIACFAGVGGWTSMRVAAVYSAKRFSLPVAIALCALIAIWVCFVMPWTIILLFTFCLGWMLLTASIIDAFEFRLPDPLTFALIASGLAVAATLPLEKILPHLIGAIAGYCVFAGLAWLYRRLRGRDGLGLGDAKLVAGAGAWLGWEALPSVILVASLAGLLWYAIAAARRGRTALAERMPFGAPLCFAIWIVWLYGPLLDLPSPT
ncbi:MAG TPA: A24 family peptidase [Rhizomicrobium sp.]|jgi:leader peptidase (prepilin peptidase)/N-methyltransferase|nr:A24 family peptidase [Rhizomicrobium sp.]